MRGHLVFFLALSNINSLWFCTGIFPLFLKTSVTDFPSNLSVIHYFSFACLLWISGIAFEAHYFLSDALWLWRTVYFLLYTYGCPIYFTFTPMSPKYSFPICLRKCHMKEHVQKLNFATHNSFSIHHCVERLDYLGWFDPIRSSQTSFSVLRILFLSYLQIGYLIICCRNI